MLKKLVLVLLVALMPFMFLSTTGCSKDNVIQEKKTAMTIIQGGNWMNAAATETMQVNSGIISFTCLDGSWDSFTCVYDIISSSERDATINMKMKNTTVYVRFEIIDSKNIYGTLKGQTFKYTKIN